MKIQSTKNYSIFKKDETNRSVDKIGKLQASMKDYGFLAAYPLHCVKNGTGFYVKDGQHRLEAAKSLGIAVQYVVLPPDDKISIARINSTQRPWTTRDYVTSFAGQGKTDYAYLLNFADAHRLPIMVCASILYGHQAATGYAYKLVKAGTFVVRNHEFAETVAQLVNTCRPHVKFAGNSLLVDAFSKCVLVKQFDVSQMIHKIGKFAHMLKLQPTVGDFLKLLESIYNYRAQKAIPLAFLANEVTRARNFGISKAA